MSSKQSITILSKKQIQPLLQEIWQSSYGDYTLFEDGLLDSFRSVQKATSPTETAQALVNFLNRNNLTFLRLNRADRERRQTT